MSARVNKPLMAAAGFICFVFIGLLMVWSVVRLELTRVFPQYTSTQMSLNFTIMMTVFCFGGFFGGKLTERRSSGFSLRLAAGLALAGFAGASLMELSADHRVALALLYVFYGAVGGFGIGLAYNVCICNISPWFPGHVGLLSGAMLLGYGCSSLLFAVVIETVCPIIGVFNIMRLMGVCLFLVLFFSSFVIRRPPLSDVSPDGETGSASDFTPGQMLRLPSFWLYFFWTAFVGSAGLLVVNSAAGIASHFGLAASIGLIVSVFNGGGRPLVGFMADRLGNTRCMIIINLLLVLSGGLLVGANASGSRVMLLFGMIGVGFCHGSIGSMSARLVCHTYGERHFGRNYGVFNFGVAVAAIIGPLASGVLQDMAGGGFGVTFLLLLIVAVALLPVLALFFVSEKRESRRSEYGKKEL